MHGQDLEAERAWQMKSSDELPPLPPGAVGKGLDGYGHLKLETSWTEHIVRSLTSQVVVGRAFWIGFEIPWKGSGEFFSKMWNESELFLGFQSIDCGGSLMARGRLFVHVTCFFWDDQLSWDSKRFCDDAMWPWQNAVNRLNHQPYQLIFAWAWSETEPESP